MRLAALTTTARAHPAGDQLGDAADLLPLPCDAALALTLTLPLPLPLTLTLTLTLALTLTLTLTLALTLTLTRCDAGFERFRLLTQVRISVRVRP